MKKRSWEPPTITDFALKETQNGLDQSEAERFNPDWPSGTPFAGGS